MTRRRALADGVHLAFLGIWLGALAMIAAGAPLVFRTMESMEPFLSDYLTYREPHYRIAGGHIVQKLFAVCDLLQSASAIGAGVTLAVAAWGSRSLRGLMGARFVCLLAVGGILAYRYYVLDPVLHGQLQAYWAAAREGSTRVAEEMRAIYDRGHQFERKLFAATALLVLTMLGLSLGSIGRYGAHPPTPGRQ